MNEQVGRPWLVAPTVGGELRPIAPICRRCESCPAGSPWKCVGRGRSGAGADDCESRVRVELAHVKALADLTLALGLVMPAGQDYDNR